MSRLAKLSRPRLHQVVARERLFERLDRGRQHPVTWVVGPPGAGKTTLVASYVEARRSAGFWYQIDAGDADPATFFYYLGEAATGSTRRKSTPLPQLTAGHGGDLAGFARLYFRALFTRYAAPATFVFDNYHELPADAPLHALIEVIARELPEGLALLVTSRNDPPPEAAALRALGRLELLEWDDLRLTLDETRGIAASRVTLDDAALQAVHERTGGWPVGLTLVLEQTRRLGVDPRRPAENDHEVLFGYFAGQIFDSLPEATREVLRLAALMPRTTAPQLARLAGEREAGALLDGLYRRRLFVDKRGDAYQLHDLFRAFLLRSLEGTRDAEAVRRARAAAARVLADDGQPEDAFPLACAARDWDIAVALLQSHAPFLFESGRGATLLAWVAALPADRVEQEPWLGLWHGVGLSSRAPAQARARFEATHARFAALGDATACTLCCGGVLMTHYLEFDNLATLDPWIDRTQAGLQAAPAFPGAAPELRVNVALLFALSFRRPVPGQLAPCIARIHELLDAGIPVNTRMDAGVLLLAHYCNTSDPEAAARLIALVQPTSRDVGVNALYQSMWAMHLGHHHLACGEDAEAEASYARALAIAESNALTIPLLHVHSRVGLAHVALARGDADAADGARAGTASFWSAARRVDSALDAGLRGLIAAHRNDTGEALALAREQLALLDTVGVVPMRYYGYLQLAHALAECEAHDDLAPTLASARGLVLGTAYAVLLPLADLLEAYAAQRRGDTALLHAALARGLAGNRPVLGNPFLRCLPRVLPMLLAEALAAGIAPEVASRAIRQFRVRAPDADAVDWPWPLEVSTFGRFEVRRDGKPLAYSRKTPRKTLALLKALFALGPGTVSEQRLLDAFWSDEEGDVAARSLDATVLRLRVLLGDAGAVIQQGGKLRLDLDRVWVDVFAFERALAASEAATRRRDPRARALRARAIDLYQGTFLPEDESETWTVATRERLRGRFIHALALHGEALEAEGEREGAIAAYLRGIDADPVVESFYQGLMRCYRALDRRTEAIAAYRRLKQILSITLGLAPSAATEQLYQSLR